MEWNFLQKALFWCFITPFIIYGCIRNIEQRRYDNRTYGYRYGILSLRQRIKNKIVEIAFLSFMFVGEAATKICEVLDEIWPGVFIEADDEEDIASQEGLA